MGADQGTKKSGPDDRQRFYGRVAVLLFALFIPVTLGSSLMIFNDGDVSWHVAAGQWIIDHRAVPTVDPFSYTFGGKPWVAFEWLSQLVLGGAYRLAGYGGLSAAVTIAFVLLHVVLVREMLKSLSPPKVAFGILAIDMVLIPFMLARPHVLAWPLFAFWLSILLKARDDNRAPPLVAALLMTLWINLHGSWAIGLAMAGVFGLEAMIANRWERKQFTAWLLFGLACVAASLVNVNGIAGFLHPLTVSQFAHLPLIQEWRPSNPNVTPVFFAVFLTILALMLWRSVQLSLVRALLLAGLAGLAFLQVRHQALLAISAGMILPRAFAGGAAAPPLFDNERERRTWLLASAALVLFAVGARIAMPVEPVENDSNPRSLIAHVPPTLRAQPMINSYSMGGPLILTGMRPFIDGRSDMYGDAFMTDFKKISDGDAVAVDSAIRHWNVTWTIVGNRQSGLIALMDKRPGWHRLYADKVGVIHVRDEADTAR